jgi:hypothetical protein
LQNKPHKKNNIATGKITNTTVVKMLGINTDWMKPYKMECVLSDTVAIIDKTRRFRKIMLDETCDISIDKKNDVSHKIY